MVSQVKCYPGQRLCGLDIWIPPSARPVPPLQAERAKKVRYLLSKVCLITYNAIARFTGVLQWSVQGEDTRSCQVLLVFD